MIQGTQHVTVSAVCFGKRYVDLTIFQQSSHPFTYLFFDLIITFLILSTWHTSEQANHFIFFPHTTHFTISFKG